MYAATVKRICFLFSLPSWARNVSRDPFVSGGSCSPSKRCIRPPDDQETMIRQRSSSRSISRKPARKMKSPFHIAPLPSWITKWRSLASPSIGWRRWGIPSRNLPALTSTLVSDQQRIHRSTPPWRPLPSGPMLMHRVGVKRRLPVVCKIPLTGELAPPLGRPAAGWGGRRREVGSLMRPLRRGTRAVWAFA